MADLIFFDIDFTVETANGPVRLQQLVDEYTAGNTVGICGNWPKLVKAWPSWKDYISIIGPYRGHGEFISPFKVEMLKEIKKALPDYDHYIMVGNIAQPTGRMADLAVADAVGFEFVKEQDYADGQRQVARSKYPKVPGIRPINARVG